MIFLLEPADVRAWHPGGQDAFRHRIRSKSCGLKAGELGLTAFGGRM
jgi:hypothetical protein